jgi:hypothetical protein
LATVERVNLSRIAPTMRNHATMHAILKKQAAPPHSTT